MPEKRGLCLCFQKTEAEVFFFGLKCRNEESEHEVRAFAFSAKASEVSGKRRGGEEKNRFSKRFFSSRSFSEFRASHDQRLAAGPRQGQRPLTREKCWRIFPPIEHISLAGGKFFQRIRTRVPPCCGRRTPGPQRKVFHPCTRNSEVSPPGPVGHSGWFPACSDGLQQDRSDSDLQ